MAAVWRFYFKLCIFFLAFQYLLAIELPSEKIVFPWTNLSNQVKFVIGITDGTRNHTFIPDLILWLVCIVNYPGLVKTVTQPSKRVSYFVFAPELVGFNVRLR